MKDQAKLLIEWLQPGQVVLVTGPNGCGKSRLIQEIIDQFKQPPVGAQRFKTPLRWAWVVQVLTDAFPDVLLGKTQEENLGHGGGWIYKFLSPGMFSVLSNLMYLVEQPDGDIVLLDDFCHDLHPHSTRQVVAAVREEAENRNLRVVLASQNSTVLDQFRDEDIRNLLVIEDRKLRLMLATDEENLAEFTPEEIEARAKFGDGLHSYLWLVQSKPSSLYDRLRFGNPVTPEYLAYCQKRDEERNA